MILHTANSRKDTIDRFSFITFSVSLGYNKQNCLTINSLGPEAPTSPSRCCNPFQLLMGPNIGFLSQMLGDGEIGSASKPNFLWFLGVTGTLES